MTFESSALPPGDAKLPVIAITMGDPAGIGPEIILKALSKPEIFRLCKPIVVGDRDHLFRTAKKLHIEPREFESADLVDLRNVADSVRSGIESANTGLAAAEYIETAVALWRRGEADAIATAPISKNALSMAGFNFPGHTEFLAKLTDTEEFAMSFFAERLRVILLSTHISLRNAIDRVKRDRLVSLIKFSEKQLSRLLKRKISLAVAGLNPHASEGGMFGSEEEDEIIPAVDECRARGINVSGPYSPDTIFLRGFRGEFDAVVSCYHDQATIAVKSLSFGSSVNVTLGLPLIRTSVDHGTAFDIAGKNIADPSSMIAAVKLAVELAVLKRTAS